MNKYERTIKFHIEDLKQLRRAGGTLEAIAAQFKISRTTLNSWRKKHKELDDALDEAEFDMDKAMANVAEKSLFSKIQDQITTRTTIDVDEDDEGHKITTTHTVTIKSPADTTAIIFALKNKAPDKWNKDEHSLIEARKKKIDSDVNLDNGADDLGRIIREGLSKYERQPDGLDN